MTHTSRSAPALPAPLPVRIPVQDAWLNGDLTIPTGASGMIVFAHGSGSSRRSPRNQYVAQFLQREGWATLLFDLLTIDEEKLDNVAGDYRFDIPFLAGRLDDATAWLRTQPVTHTLPVAYFGASTGAAAALVAAANGGRSIAAVVSRGGRPDLAGKHLPHVTSPTLLIVGERDEAVLAQNREAQRLLICDNDLQIVPGATHLFEEAGALDHVCQLARDWFARYLPRTTALPDAGRGW